MTLFKPTYQMFTGWAGVAKLDGEQQIYLTLYMTFISFVIGGLLGLIAGLITSLDSTRWDYRE